MTRVSKIEYVGEKEQQCISVDSKDHLYQTDGGMVTCNTVVSGVLSELAFFRDAGKALTLDTPILMADGSSKTMGNIEVGDKVSHPYLKETEVVGIPWQDNDLCYEIEMEDGRTVQCNAEHLWPVKYKEGNEQVNKIVTTQFMIDHPELEFDIQEYFPTALLHQFNISMVKTIKPIGKKPQKCITVSADDGLFVLNNKLVTHNSDDFIMRVFNDLKSRINNRMQGNYFGRTVLDSSPNTLDSPIDDYIVNHAKNDPTNFIVKGSEWEWAPEDFDMTKTFKVYTGGKGQPPKILDVDESEDQYSPEKLIDVPMELKQSFKDDLYKSLKDRAGIPAGSADMLIYDHQKIEDIFNPKLKNIYTHIKASENQNSYRLIWDQIVHKFFRERAGKLEFWYKPWLPRCISVDQSIVGDVTCIGMVHAERIRESEEQMFVVDFTIPIAPMGERINLDAIKFFIEDLRDVGNMYIPHVSFDQFQSELSLQYLRSKGFDAEKLSVDRTTDPYFFLLGLVNRGNIVAGRNLHIKNNLKSLKLVTEHRGKAKKAKVDHDDSRPVVTSGTEEWSKSLIGAFAKDATDSIAGAIELNRMYFPVATEFWDPAYLDTLLDTKKQRKNAEGSVSAFLNKMGVG